MSRAPVIPLRDPAAEADVLVILREIRDELHLSTVKGAWLRMLYPVLAEVVGNMALRQVPC